MISILIGLAQWAFVAIFLLLSATLLSGSLTPRNLRWPIIALGISAFIIALWLQSLIAQYGLNRAISEFLFYASGLLSDFIQLLEKVANASRGLIGLGPISLQSYLPSQPSPGSFPVSSAQGTWVFCIGFLALYFVTRFSLWFAYLIGRVVYLLVTSVLNVLRWIGRILFVAKGRSGHITREIRRSKNPVFDFPPSYSFLWPTLMGTACAVGAAIVAPLVVKMPDALNAFYAHFFWAGAWIVLIEAVPMVRVARSVDVDRSIVAVGAGAVEVGLQFEALYRAYVEKHKALILYANKYQQLPAVHAGEVFSTETHNDLLLIRIQERLQKIFPDDSTSVQQAVDLARALVSKSGDPQDGNILLNESLSQSHFIFFSEFIQYFQTQSEYQRQNLCSKSTCSITRSAYREIHSTRQDSVPRARPVPRSSPG